MGSWEANLGYVYVVGERWSVVADLKKRVLISRGPKEGWGLYLYGQRDDIYI